MAVHTFHLAEVGPRTTMRAILRPPTQATVRGLINAECMTTMELGLPLASPSRLQPRRLGVFAAWEREAAIDDFLASPGLGSSLAHGWHVRLELLRRWGHISGFDEPVRVTEEHDADAPVVAVTMARLKLPQLPRFIQWGKPVELLVRDHPAATLAVAGMRPPRLLATFSMWRSQHEMIDMVGGTSDRPDAQRHVAAMAEQRRKDFHHEFAALRFRPLAEYGVWQGRSAIVPAT